MNPSSTQTTVAASIGSTGFSGALVGIAIAVLGHFGIAVSAEVAADLGVLVTAGLHYLVVMKFLPMPANTTAPA
jgi:hypothetical protein